MSMTKMKIKLDTGAFMPVRAHAADAGLDLMTPRCNSSLVHPRGSVTIDTGVHIAIPRGYFGKIESRSGLNVKHGIVSCGGVIDEGYTGSIRVRLYNLSDKEYRIAPGDKIAQIVIQPCIKPELEIVEELDETPRGNKGLGSTGE